MIEITIARTGYHADACASAQRQCQGRPMSTFASFGEGNMRVGSTSAAALVTRPRAKSDATNAVLTGVISDNTAWGPPI